MEDGGTNLDRTKKASAISQISQTDAQSNFKKRLSRFTISIPPIDFLFGKSILKSENKPDADHRCSEGKITKIGFFQDSNEEFELQGKQSSLLGVSFWKNKNLENCDKMIYIAEDSAEEPSFTAASTSSLASVLTNSFGDLTGTRRRISDIDRVSDTNHHVQDANSYSEISVNLSDSEVELSMAKSSRLIWNIPIDKHEDNNHRGDKEKKLNSKNSLILKKSRSAIFTESRSAISVPFDKDEINNQREDKEKKLNSKNYLMPKKSRSYTFLEPQEDTISFKDHYAKSTTTLNADYQ